MPSPIDSSTLKSANLPAVLVEVATLLTNAETAIPAETRPDRVTVSYSFETNEFTIAATVPGIVVIDGTGKPLITPSDYIP